MEQLNQSLFLLINADAQANQIIVMLAKFIAEIPIWLIPALLVIGWMRGDSTIRRALLTSAMTAGVALLINQLISLFWQHPRPFMMGIGHTLIPHVADSSFPSDHMTLICSIAFAMLYQPALRRIGALLLCLSLPVAWARIYLGVHFPLDMLGATLVSFLSVLCIHQQQSVIVEPIFKPILIVYETLMSPAIKRGWLK